MSKLICKRWAFDLSTWTPTLPELATAITSVQPEERERLMKFYFIEDFLSSLIGRLLMRKFVSESTDLEFNAVKFARDDKGKPYWVTPVTPPTAPITLSPQSRAQKNSFAIQQKLSFNISHQGNFVVLAGLLAINDNETLEVANGNIAAAPLEFGIGVDVMKIEYNSGKPLTEFFRLMHKKFSATEWRYIMRPQHNNDFDKIKAFMRHWCLKEAYVKELGVGITIDLQKISFSVAADETLNDLDRPLNSTTLIVNEQQINNWHFEEHLLHADYCAAIAFKNCQPAVNKFEYLNINDLLNKQQNTTKICDEEIELLEYCKNALKKQKKLP